MTDHVERLRSSVSAHYIHDLHERSIGRVTDRVEQLRSSVGPSSASPPRNFEVHYPLDLLRSRSGLIDDALVAPLTQHNVEGACPGMELEMLEMFHNNHEQSF